MLKIRNTPQAVLWPGSDSDYFDQLTLADVPLQDTDQYDPKNAWWLAELSRVIYRQSVAENDKVLPDRVTVLQNAGHEEVAFVRGSSTEAAIIRVGGFHVLTFRGTRELMDWVRNLEMWPEKWDGPGRVHTGFVRALDEVWEKLQPALSAISGPVFYTGHSLGGALAILAAARIPARAVYTYGGPRCGDDAFAAQHPLRERIHRVVNNRDVVTRVPPGYEHTGTLHYITSTGTMLTNPSKDVVGDDRDVDDETHAFLKGDLVPESFADHAPVNYVAWMQRLALGG